VGAKPTISTRQWARIAAVGAEIVFVAESRISSSGRTKVGSRRGREVPDPQSFLEMQTRDDFRELHEHKDAGMEHTIIVGAQPMVAPENPDAPGLVRRPAPADHRRPARRRGCTCSDSSTAASRT